MSKVIAFYTLEKKVAVIYPVWKCKFEDETDNRFLERMSEPVPLQSKWSIRYQEKEDLPDDYFEDAWLIGAENVIVDVRKARDIHYDSIIAERDIQLENLDKPEFEAWSKGDDESLKEIRNKKQSLRDLSDGLKSTLNEIDDLDKLKGYWPELLKK